MKFGKRLKKQIEDTLPEWRDKFLSYKRLKKLVRLSSAAGSSPEAEAEFVRLLDAEIDKLNAFFLEQEEEFVIRRRELRDRINNAVEAFGPTRDYPSEAERAAEMRRTRKAVVNFHGEMVLLVNYSAVNYTGLAKILKKYDKRTGRLLRLPFIEKVLKQPFLTTEIISQLVKECESMIEAVFPASAEAREHEVETRVNEDTPSTSGDGIFRNTVAALITMQELRKGNSTNGPWSSPGSDLLQSLQHSPPITIQ